MKIGIIGSGEVGQTLATAFLKEGHEVMLGTRNTSKDEVVKWKKENPSGKTGTFEEAAKFGELLVLSVALIKRIQKLIPDAKVVKRLIALEVHLCINQIFLVENQLCLFVVMMMGQRKLLRIYLQLSVTTRKTWVKLKRQELLNHFVFYGVSRVLSVISGHMHSSY